AEEAEKFGRASQRLFNQINDAINVETVKGTHALAELRQAQGRYKEAEQLYETALALAKNEQLYGSEHRVIGQILCNLGTLHAPRHRADTLHPGQPHDAPKEGRRRGGPVRRGLPHLGKEAHGGRRATAAVEVLRNLGAALSAPGRLRPGGHQAAKSPRSRPKV